MRLCRDPGRLIAFRLAFVVILYIYTLLFDLHCVDAAVTSSRGMVGSVLMVSTASWPHTAAIAAPACLAGGEVMLPWAETAAAKREALTIDAFILIVVNL